jgi:polyhydroxybutyrate depolymerase
VLRALLVLPVLVSLCLALLPGDLRPALASTLPGCGAPRNHAITITYDGLRRTALLHVPPSYTGGSRPLVIGLAGAGDNGRHFEQFSGLRQQSDSAGFVAVFPTAAGTRPFWNISAFKSGADDVGYISALIDQLEQSGCADPARVYATGVSNGGGMTALLGCRLADKIAAIAPVAGGYKTLPSCVPARPLPVLEIHGSRDPIVPYAGRPPDRLGSVPRFLVSWAQRDSCAIGAHRSSLAPATIQSVWTGCTAGTSVVGIKLYGAGHLWPGSHPPVPQGPSTLAAASTVWNFFKQFAMPSPPY